LTNLLDYPNISLVFFLQAVHIALHLDFREEGKKNGDLTPKTMRVLVKDN